MEGLRARLVPMQAIVRIPSMRWYWINAVASAFGDSLSSTALLLVIIRETDSVASMALMSMMMAVPAILFGILSGTLVDRWDARRTVVQSQSVRALVILGLIYVDVGGALWFAYVLAFAQSLIGTFDDPARARMVRAITSGENRLAVNSLTASGTQIASVLGTTVAGVLIGLTDTSWMPFVLSAVMFFGGGLAFGRIGVDAAPIATTGPEQSFLTRTRVGFDTIRRSAILRGTTLSIAATSLGLGMATIALLPLITQVLRINEAWFGAIEASQTSAMILASLTIAFVANRIAPRRLAVNAVLGIGIAIVLLSQVPSVWWLFPAMFLLGLLIAPMGSGFNTILQTETDLEVLGRVAATINTFAQAASLLAMAVGGVLGDVIGVRETMAVAGGLCLIAGVVTIAQFRLAPPAADDIDAVA